MKQFFFAWIASFCLVFYSSAQEIKILTYNIHHGERTDTPGTPNFADIANLLVQLQPEVTALQEVDSMTLRSGLIYGEKLDYIKRMARETGYKGYFGKSMPFEEGSYGNGLLVKKGSKYHTLALPNPAGGEPRSIAWVKAELKTLEEFYFGGTHLCHEFEANRIAQLDSIFSYADSLDRPAIIVGDMNFPPDSLEYQRIPSHWKEAGAVAGSTQPTYGTLGAGARIDYIWYDSRKFEFVSYKVLDSPFSDHFPVLTVLRMIKNSP